MHPSSRESNHLSDEYHLCFTHSMRWLLHALASSREYPVTLNAGSNGNGVFVVIIAVLCCMLVLAILDQSRALYKYDGP